MVMNIMLITMICIYFNNLKELKTVDNPYHKRLKSLC